MKSALSLISGLLLLLEIWVALPGASRAAAGLLRVEDPVEDERGIVALDQALREVSSPFTVVCVGARPGDEDDGSLAYLRKKFGARTVMLFATRGEGEASATLAEFGRELGAVRTREAIEAARVLGSDVMFLNLSDPGYCNSPEETLAEWGHDEALRRFVRAYRSLRPDVIITSHDSSSGEGAARATAALALEAFGAAADAKVAPEAGFEPWQAQRFFRLSRESGADVVINLDEYDRFRGRNYAQMGLDAHRRFVSRGANLDRPTPERERSFYKLLESASDQRLERGAGLFDGLAIPEKVSRAIAPPRVGDQSLVDAVAAGDRLIDALLEKLVEKRAEGSLADLRGRYGAQFVRVARYTVALERALALALGIRLQVSVSDPTVVPGQKLAVRATLQNGSNRAFPVVFSAPEQLPTKEKPAEYRESEVLGVGSGGVASKEFEYVVAKESRSTLPASSHLFEDYYAVGSSLPGAQPGEPFGNQLIVSAEVGLGQTSIHLAALARFALAPPVQIYTLPLAVLKDWSTPRDFEIEARVCNRTPGPLTGALWVVPLAISNDEYEPLHLSFTREDQEITVKLKLRLPILKPPLNPDVLIEFRPEKPAPPDPLGSAKIAVRALDAETSEGLKVGYISGPSKWLAGALAGLGLDHRELKTGELSSIEHGHDAAQTRPGCMDLSSFDALLVDEDAYLAHPDLILQNRCLLRYAKQGGNLVVLEQRSDDWNLVLSGAQLTPYPIKLSKDRLTFEKALVKILESEHALVSKPNQLTFKDFEGWTVERAVNVPREWSAEYTPLLETSDPGQDPNRGTLLVARYGEGTYVFTSLALRRQLTDGNPGAYRLLANLVSLSKTSKPAPRPQ